MADGQETLWVEVEADEGKGVVEFDIELGAAVGIPEVARMKNIGRGEFKFMKALSRGFPDE